MGFKNEILSYFLKRNNSYKKKKQLKMNYII